MSKERGVLARRRAREVGPGSPAEPPWAHEIDPEWYWTSLRWPEASQPEGRAEDEEVHLLRDPGGQVMAASTPLVAAHMRHVEPEHRLAGGTVSHHEPGIVPPGAYEQANLMFAPERKLLGPYAARQGYRRVMATRGERVPQFGAGAGYLDPLVAPVPADPGGTRQPAPGLANRSLAQAGRHAEDVWAQTGQKYRDVPPVGGERLMSPKDTARKEAATQAETQARRIWPQSELERNRRNVRGEWNVPDPVGGRSRPPWHPAPPDEEREPDAPMPSEERRIPPVPKPRGPSV